MYDAPDSEAITIALLPNSFGSATLKRAYKLVRDKWRSAFPRLCSYKQWVQRRHQLSGLVGQLVRAVSLRLEEADNFYLHYPGPTRASKTVMALARGADATEFAEPGPSRARADTVSAPPLSALPRL